ncbi:MAG: leucine-rich repeat domain-containing protein [Candidatus Hodarchaeota archaeon]
MALIDDISVYAPAVAALLLSLYNWYLMRRGANIQPDKLITYGLQNITWEDHQRYNRQEKYLYFPVLLNNEGMKAGVVSNIEIFFKGANGEKKIETVRRVDMNKAGGQLTIEELVPPLPISIPAGEGMTVTFECRDAGNEIIPINEDLTCKIAVRYGKNHTSSIKFPFKVTSEDMLKARNVVWLQAIESKKPAEEILTDREVLKGILEEINQEDMHEIILNRETTEFDRTTEFGGTKLTSLSLSRLKLTTLPKSISNLKHLQILHLDDNLMSSLPESLGELKELKRLFLENNQLASLPESIGELTKLEHLNLHNNQLTSLPERFGNLVSLEYLNLRKNRISSLPENFGNLKSLEALYTDDNELSALPKSFGKLSNLREMESRRNQLTSLPQSIGNLAKLRRLDLEENKLTSLPESINNATSLYTLNAKNNQLISLPEGLDRLIYLKSLLVSSNQITTLPETVEQSLETLKKRGCSVYL